jgi:hypothetical protein
VNKSMAAKNEKEREGGRQEESDKARDNMMK